MKKFHLLYILFLIFISSCNREELIPFNTPKNILIIGNSYTYFNNGLIPLSVSNPRPGKYMIINQVVMAGVTGGAFMENEHT